MSRPGKGYIKPHRLHQINRVQILRLKHKLTQGKTIARPLLLLRLTAAFPKVKLTQNKTKLRLILKLLPKMRRLPKLLSADSQSIKMAEISSTPTKTMKS